MSAYTRMLDATDASHPYDTESDTWEQEAARDLEADIKLAAIEFRDRIRDLWNTRDCGRFATTPDWDNTEELIRDDLESNVFYAVFEALGRE